MTFSSTQASNRLQMKPVYMVLGFSLMLFAVMAIFSSSASAHGYIESPASRAALCKSGVNSNCGNIQYEPQSLEAKGNFPAAGPADGQITGAGAFPELYEQSAHRWEKVNMNGGANTFTWKLTAAHATKEWKYYITKKGWDSSKPLARADLELFCSIDDGGKRPDFTVSHTCNVPTDRSGYNLILGVWEIADTGNAFYQVIDVNLNNGGTGGTTPTPDTQAPTAPANLTSSNTTATSVALAWNASSDNVGVTKYEIYRGTTLAGSVAGSVLNYTVNGLTANTAYNFTVKAFDAAGNVSPASNAVTVTTSNAASTYPAWNAATSYVGGSKVTYEGVNYEAKWWTLGETPTGNNVWKVLP